MLAQACPYLSLMLTHVAHILADVGPMLAPRPSRCPVFRWPMVFCWPCKKRCFLSGNREPESGRAGRRQGRQPYVTFGLRRGHGRGAGAGFMLTPDSRAPAKADPSARAGVVVVVVVLLLLADVGPIWAQVCPCLGPRLAHVAHILA